MHRPTLHSIPGLASLGLAAALTPTGCTPDAPSNATSGFASAGDGDGDETSGDGDGDGPTNCGNGVVDSGEECDLGAENSDNGPCTASCTLAECGDGAHYEGFEECDDGNTSNSDACVSGCLLATCGDGFMQSGVEECDDGNDVETDGCTSACTPSSCGDGVVQADEQCDDGNAEDGDECPTSCQLAFCGDGFVQLGVEECDDGNTESNDACLGSFCVAASCGDGFLWEGMEECDDGNLDDHDACPGSCAPAFCGDGFTYYGMEECDDGNDVDDDFCMADCTSNGYFDDFETGDLMKLPWTTSGNDDWTAATSDPHEGMWSAASGTIFDYGSTTLEVMLDVPEAGIVQFWHHVSSEEYFDYLYFFIDNVQQGDGWSGELGWQQAEYPIPAGNHALRWVYSKDGSLSEYSDKVWIDEVYVGLPP
jgi:cysteine-rich repeat protein